MKRLFCLILALAMLLSMAACGKGQSRDYVEAPEEITLDMLRERTRTDIMINFAGGFRADMRDDDSANGGQNAYTTSMRFLYDGNYICANQLVDYDNGAYQHIFFSTNPNDATIYMDSNDGVQSAVMDDRQLQNILEQTMFGIENYDCVIDECKKSGEGFAVTVSCYSGEILDQKLEINLDGETGMVTDALVYRYMDGAEAGVGKLTVTYGKDVAIDYSPKEKVGSQTTSPEAAPDAEEAAAPKTGAFTFATTDIDGNFVSYNDFAEATTIMVHYFDPADEACVSKLPDLQNLYQDREKEGFLIIGVIATDAADEDVKAIVDEAGLTFPILHMDNRLKTWYANQAPSTVFFNENGDIMTDEPYFGALSYADWETVLNEQLTGEEVDNTIVEMD